MHGVGAGLQLQLGIVHQEGRGEHDLRLGEAGREAAVVAEAERGVRIQLAVFGAVGKVAVDVELGGFGEVFFKVVGQPGRADHPRPGGNAVARRLEAVARRAQDDGHRRIEAQHFQRQAVHRVQLAERFHGRRLAAGEHGVRFGAQAFRQLRALERFVDGERGGDGRRVHAGDERPHGGHQQVRLRQELRVGVVQVEHVVDQVAGVGQRAARAVLAHRQLEQLVDATPSGVVLAPVQEHRLDLGDAREQQQVEKGRQIVEIGVWRHVGEDGAELIHDDALQRRLAGERLAFGPRIDMAPADGQRGADVLLEALARVAVRERLAQARVFGAVQTGDDLAGADLFQGARPAVLGAQEHAALAMHEMIHLRPGEDDELVAEQAHPEHGPVAPIAAHQEGHQILGRAEDVAHYRQAAGQRDGLLGPHDGRGSALRLCRLGSFPNRLRNRLADQVEAADDVQALRALAALLRRERPLEEAARIGETDDDDIVRRRHIAAEEDAHDAQPHFLFGLAVDDRVAAGAGRRRRQVQAALVHLQDVGVQQPRQRGVFDFLGIGREPTHPELGAAHGRLRRHCGQHRIEQVVAKGGGIDDDKLGEVGVDAPFDGQVHQQCASQRKAKVLRRHDDDTVVFVQQQQQEFFGETHSWRPVFGSGWRAFVSPVVEREAPFVFDPRQNRRLVAMRVLAVLGQGAQVAA